ncbi:aspartate aminotransferase family protein [Oceanomicrobium pacificus]|uniref:Acetylornithine aminotransferase n=1 Tax=Oceanomicrobium pacificus TaxID=2692916 RepID=A0A6B0TSA8_9RHOB|nr:aspartate aminotransferase family protein [Oceanomicrobium pacificus]MXU66876.1 acetylornithine/succinylornithine family transaminase [Oceanomicrobium pacificus]
MISPVLPTYARAPLSFVKGQGPWLETETGERYMDFGAGIAVTALGHANPVLIAALEDQARRLWHTSNLYEIPRQKELAAKLVDASFADTVFMTNSGTEAMECAVKMARKYFSATGQPERVRIITFEGAFHGRTLGMISASGSEKMTAGFGPMLPGFDTVPFGDMEAVIAATGDETAAIIVEPVQGEGGIRPASPEFLRALRAHCDANGLLLVMDEIQCGMGRTGKLFAHEWAGVAPDIMAVAKGIGGGFPLGACLATEEAAQGMVAGTHGSTYGGNPLACAVGCAVMDALTAPGFMEEVQTRGSQLRQGLESLAARFPDLIEGVRGIGLMMGVKCKAPNAELVGEGYAAHLLTVPAADNIVRVLPPLNITAEELAEGLGRLETALGTWQKKTGSAGA